MVKLYEYNVKITIEDGTVKEKIYKSKKEIEVELGVSVSTINNILSKQTKKKYSFLEIEKLEVKNLEETKQERQRMYSKRNYEKKNMEKINAKSASEKAFNEIKEKINATF